MTSWKMRGRTGRKDGESKSMPNHNGTEAESIWMEGPPTWCMHRVCDTTGDKVYKLSDIWYKIL